MSLPAVIFPILQTGASANGGIESITYIMSHLRDHRPVVVTNRETGHSVKWCEAGIETHIVAETASRGLRRSLSGYLLSYARYHRAVVGLIQSEGARIVHANDPLAFQLSLSAAKQSGAKIALNLRDTLDPGRRPPHLRYRFLFAAADHVFYLSEDMADRWTHVAPNATRSCTVTYSVVDRKRFRPSPLPEEGPRVVLCSGIFRPKKGQLEFIRHVAPVLAARGIEIWFAGDFDPALDAYTAACVEAARPMGAAVRFLGYRSDLPQLIGRSSVVAIPSRHEGLMRSMIEAMSCARPVVSFDVCSAREVLEGHVPAGMVIPQGDFGAMADALILFCGQQDLAARAGRAGVEAAQRRFDIDSVVARYENAYAALAG